MSDLLIDDYPLVVLPRLAVAVGLNEGLILQQIHYWAKVKQRDPSHYEASFRDGRCWVYNSLAEWHEQFPFWSTDTISRALISLKKQGLIVVEQFGKSDWDRTNWYAIDYDALNSLTIPVPESAPPKPKAGAQKLRQAKAASCESRRPQNAAVGDTQVANVDDRILRSSLSETPSENSAETNPQTNPPPAPVAATPEVAPVTEAGSVGRSVPCETPLQTCRTEAANLQDGTASAAPSVTERPRSAVIEPETGNAPPSGARNGPEAWRRLAERTAQRAAKAAEVGPPPAPVTGPEVQPVGPPVTEAGPDSPPAVELAVELVREFVSYGFSGAEAEGAVRAHGEARCREALRHVPILPTVRRQGRWVAKCLAEGWTVGEPPRAWKIGRDAGPDIERLIGARGRGAVCAELLRRADVAERSGDRPLARRRRRVVELLRGGAAAQDAITRAAAEQP